MWPNFSTTAACTTLYRIGVDEICYRHPHRYLTIIGDHDTGTVIDIQSGAQRRITD